MQLHVKGTQVDCIHFRGDQSIGGVAFLCKSDVPGWHMYGFAQGEGWSAPLFFVLLTPHRGNRGRLCGFRRSVFWNLLVAV